MFGANPLAHISPQCSEPRVAYLKWIPTSQHLRSRRMFKPWPTGSDLQTFSKWTPTGSSISTCTTCRASPESQLVGGPIQSMKNAVQAANPITYVSQDDAPFQIVYGDSDRLVPHHQSELLHAALRSAGVAVEFHTVPGGGHGGPESVFAPMDELLMDFFDRHLRVPPRGSNDLGRYLPRCHPH